MKGRGKPYFKNALTNITCIEENVSKGMEFYNLKTLFGAVMVTGEPVIANNPATDPRRGGLPDGHPPLNSFLGLPLFDSNKQLVGMVGIANRPGGYDELPIAYLEPFIMTCGNVIAAHRNNKRRQEVEEKLRESEELFRATFEQAAVGIARVATDGTFLEINQKFCDLVGYNREEMLNLTFKDITHPEDLKVDLNYECQILAGEISSYSMEKRYIRKDGTLQWVNLTVSLVRDLAGALKYFISIVEDINARKKAEAALQISEKRLQLAIEAANDGLWDWNVVTGEVYFNAQLQEMLGYEAGELKGHVNTWINLMHPDDMPPVMEVLNKHFEYPEFAYVAEFRLRTKSVEWKWILAQGKVVERDREGSPLRMIGTHKDISDRKRTEQALLRINRNLQAAERIAHIGSWEYDLKTETITWSDELFRIFRMEPGQKAPTFPEVLQQYHPDDRELFQQIRSLLQLDSCLFIWYLPSGKDNRSTQPAWHVVHEAKNSDLPTLLGYYLTDATGTCERAIAQLEIIRIDDIETIINPVEPQFFLTLGYKSLLDVRGKLLAGQLV